VKAELKLDIEQMFFFVKILVKISSKIILNWIFIVKSITGVRKFKTCAYIDWPGEIYNKWKSKLYQFKGMINW